MEELSSLWNHGYDYQENFNELKLKLQYTTIELDSIKMEANEQVMKYKEESKLMLDLLYLAYQERDQYQKLLNKLMPYTQPESPLMLATKANSSLTESNTLSDTYNYNNGSSPVESLFDAVTSPDFLTTDSSGIGFMNQQPFVPAVTRLDSEMALFDDLAKGKSLPEKGKLLQAVMEAAGPLLSTLLVAGPPSDAFKILPGSKIVNQKPVANQNKSVVRKRMTRRNHQMCSSTMLCFESSGSQLLSSSKRQRFE